MRSRALPLATREVLNKMAFESRKESQQTITREFVLRNKFTVKSIRVDRAMGMDISAQKSVMGSIADYMDEQEDGGTKNRRRGRTVGIPTSFSAGQGRGMRPRTKLPRSMYKMANIAITRSRQRGQNRRQQVAISIATSKGGFAYLDLGRRKGIFKIDKKGIPTMVHDLTRTSVRIPRTRWMWRSIDKVIPKRGEYYKTALENQLARI